MTSIILNMQHYVSFIILLTKAWFRPVLLFSKLTKHVEDQIYVAMFQGSYVTQAAFRLFTEKQNKLLCLYKTRSQ